MASTMTFRPGDMAQDRFSRYFTFAVAAHVVVFGALAILPGEWLGRGDEPEKDIMYISLGGAPGPRLGGLNSIDARPVQQEVPEPPRPQFQAPAAAKPVMTVPEKPVAKPVPPTKTPIQSTAEPSASRTPIRGTQIREGQARVDTRAVTQGTGLSLGGGEQGTGGETNLGDFCCPAYLEAMIAAIYRNWKQNHGVAGSNVVRFIIERDGRVSKIELMKPSGQHLLDRESQVALSNARLPALPPEFKDPRLIIRLTFEYSR